MLAFVMASYNAADLNLIKTCASSTAAISSNLNGMNQNTSVTYC